MTFSLRKRLAWAWAAFKAGPSFCAGDHEFPPQELDHPLYGVIYDEVDVTDEDGDPRETYYEAFDSPGQAHAFFRDAYPVRDEADQNARLVLILGPIDNYRRRAL